MLGLWFVESKSVSCRYYVGLDLFVGWKEACTTQGFACLLNRCDPSLVFEKVFGKTLVFWLLLNPSEILVDPFSLAKTLAKVLFSLSSLL